MGKGDRKTKKGKIIKGSFGVSRPRKKNRVSGGAEIKVAKPATKKTAKKEEE